MALVAALVLRAFHYLYSFVILCCSFCLRLCPSFSQSSRRRRIPEHLAILLVPGTTEDHSDLSVTLVRTVTDAVSWCCASGIQQLTVYEEHGALLKLSRNICDSLATEFEESSDDFDTKYPLTPPPSDYSESRPISPQRNLQADSHVLTIRVPTMKRHNLPPKSGVVRHMGHAFDFSSQNQLTLCLMSRKSSKPAIASVAQALLSCAKQKQRMKSKHVKADIFTLSVDDLEGLLEFDRTLLSPDVMIVHSLNPQQDPLSPLEFHGYPPWQIRLTEIYHNRPDHSRIRSQRVGHPSPSKYMLLTEDSFKRALDEYAAAEMRFGK